MTDMLGPAIIQLDVERGPRCTACGATMTAVLFATTRQGDAVLCCDGCGRRGVFCQCADPWSVDKAPQSVEKGT